MITQYTLPIALCMCGCLVFLLGMPPLHAQDAQKADLYVATDGDDKNPGTLDRPLATLAAARDRLRPMLAGMDRDLTVMIRGGTYYLSEPFRLTPEDSGRNERSVTYRNYPGETPELVGGRVITGWRKAEGDIWQAKVEDGWTFNQLFADGKRQTNARHPNTGYFHVEAEDEKRRSTAFGYAAEDLPDWEIGPEAQVYIWASYDWFASLAPVASVDYANRIITLSERTHTPIYKRKDRRYFIQGVREALDSPGEFFLDRTAGILYFWPPSPDIDAQTIVAPTLSRVIDISGESSDDPAHHIRLEGLKVSVSGFRDYFTETYGGTHEDTPWNEPCNKEGMVTLHHADDCAIRFCEITNAGYSGVALVHRAMRNEIYGNLIHDAGFHGVLLAGYGGRFGAEMDLNKANEVVNNHIHHCGKLVGHGGGVFVHSSGHNRIAHNLIHNMPRYGICSKNGVAAPPEMGRVPYGEHWQYTHSRNNVYEYNDIHHCNEDTEDSGFISFHTVGRDNIVRNNLIHDGERELGGLGFGIYLDDGSSHFTVEDNVIYNIQNGDKDRVNPIYAKGIYNVIRNNILVGEEKTGSAITTFEMANLQCRHHRWTRNIVYLKGADTHLWGFTNWSDDRFDECDRNLFWKPNGGEYTVRGRFNGGFKTVSLDDWREMGFDRNSIVADPLFVDPDNNDYRLKPDSPALTLGFKPIDVSTCGLLADFPFGG